MSISADPTFSCTGTRKKSFLKTKAPTSGRGVANGGRNGVAYGTRIAGTSFYGYLKAFWRIAEQTGSLGSLGLCASSASHGLSKKLWLRDSKVCSKSIKGMGGLRLMHGPDDPKVSFRPPTCQNARKHALKGDPATPDRPRCPRRAALRVSSEGSDTDCRFFFPFQNVWCKDSVRL